MYDLSHPLTLQLYGLSLQVMLISWTFLILHILQILIFNDSYWYLQIPVFVCLNFSPRVDVGVLLPVARVGKPAVAVVKLALERLLT